MERNRDRLFALQLKQRKLQEKGPSLRHPKRCETRPKNWEDGNIKANPKAVLKLRSMRAETLQMLLAGCGGRFQGARILDANSIHVAGRAGEHLTAVRRRLEWMRKPTRRLRFVVA